MKSFMLFGRLIVVILTVLSPLGAAWGETVVVTRRRSAGPGSAASAGPADRARGLHLPKDRRIGFNHNMNDGGGFRWDIQRYGNVQHGTEYLFSGGLRLQIQGSSFRPSDRQGWANKAGDEIEVGPSTRNNLRIYRRIKVYKDRPLARWLDIFENPSPTAVTVPVAIYSSVNYGIRRTISSSGGAAFGDKDWAFITETARGRSPSLLQMVCGPRARLRPSVQQRGNQLYVKWQLTVPPRKTVVLCHFVSQGHSINAHQDAMAKFRVVDVLRDLSPGVRAMIVNWRGGGYAGVELDRSGSADTVIVADGARKLGKISSKSFSLETFFGPLALPAARVVGMAAMGGGGSAVRFVLADGQIVSAALPKGHVDLELPTGGSLRIPFAEIRQWSFRLSDDRPPEFEFSGPTVRLRTGDRLLFDAASLKPTFRTRYGSLALAPDQLLRIALDNEDNAVHRAVFLNGSHLAGFLEPGRISLKLQLGPVLEVARDMVAEIVFAADERGGDDPFHVVLSNDDELLGTLVEKQIEVAGKFGSVAFSPDNVRSIVFSPTHLGWASLRLWDGSQSDGRVAAKALSFRIGSGPLVRIHPAQFVRITCTRVLPPPKDVARARKLIGLLGAESYKDRQDATEKLIAMGKPILPILRGHLQDTDPEVRHRIEGILEKLGDKPGAPKTGGNPPGNMIRPQLRLR